jgi:hypothetical protein
MEMEPGEKTTAYETLISISLYGSWSAKHLVIEHSYRYYQDLCRQGKVEIAAKQFIRLKKHLAQAVGRIRKKTKSKTKKQILKDILLLLEVVDSIAEVDRIITGTLMIIGQGGQPRKHRS